MGCFWWQGEETTEKTILLVAALGARCAMCKYLRTTLCLHSHHLTMACEITLWCHIDIARMYTQVQNSCKPHASLLTCPGQLYTMSACFRLCLCYTHFFVLHSHIYFDKKKIGADGIVKLVLVKYLWTYSVLFIYFILHARLSQKLYMVKGTFSFLISPGNKSFCIFVSLCSLHISLF